MLPYTTSLTRGRGAAGVSQLQRSHGRGRGEVPQRLPGGRPLGLGEAVTRRDDDEESAYGVGFARDFAGAVRETDAREGQAEILEVQLFLRAEHRYHLVDVLRKRGHLCVEIKFQALHAIDATLSLWVRL